jgi:hypothetical protein
MSAVCIASLGCQSAQDPSRRLNSRNIREAIVTDLYASPFTTVSKTEFRTSEQQQVIVRGKCAPRSAGVVQNSVAFNARWQTVRNGGDNRLTLPIACPHNSVP